MLGWLVGKGSSVYSQNSNIYRKIVWSIPPLSKKYPLLSVLVSRSDIYNIVHNIWLCIVNMFKQKFCIDQLFSLCCSCIILALSRLLKMQHYIYGISYLSTAYSHARSSNHTNDLVVLVYKTVESAIAFKWLSKAIKPCIHFLHLHFVCIFKEPLVGSIPLDNASFGMMWMHMKCSWLHHNPSDVHLLTDWVFLLSSFQETKNQKHGEDYIQACHPGVPWLLMFLWNNYSMEVFSNSTYLHLNPHLHWIFANSLLYNDDMDPRIEESKSASSTVCVCFLLMQQWNIVCGHLNIKYWEWNSYYIPPTASVQVKNSQFCLNFIQKIWPQLHFCFKDFKFPYGSMTT